jgi:hypothetical protein
MDPSERNLSMPAHCPSWRLMHSPAPELATDRAIGRCQLSNQL